MPHKPGNGAIFGIVSEDGIAKTNFPVTLLDRTTGKMVSRQFTDQNGGFVFNGLDPETDDYQVIGQDEDGETYKNAVIRDRIRPVPGYQGATYHGNWRHLANEIGFLACYQGQISHNYTEDTLSGTVIDYPAAQAPMIRNAGNGSDGAISKPLFLETATPGDPSIPVTLFQDQTMAVYPRFSKPNFGDFGFQKNPAHTALEIAADFSNLSSTSGWVGICTSLQYYSREFYTSTSGASVICAFYNVASKYLRVCVNGTSSGSVWSSYYRINIGDVSLADYPGMRHIILSAAYGDRLEVYIDGELIETLSMAGQPVAQNNATDGSYGYLGGIAVAGEYDYNNTTSYCRGVTGPISLITWYARSVTADEVKALHNALMVGVQPRLTGYLKEVYVERPSFYARLNEPLIEDGFKSLTGISGYQGYGYGLLQMLQPSIVSGGNTVRFDGNSGVRFDYDAPTLYNPFGLTALFVAQPEIELPTKFEELLRTTNNAESFNHGLIIRRTETGLLSLLIRCGGSTETIEFMVPTDNTAIHHYAMTVDKLQGTAILYVDGEVAFETTTTSILIDRPPGDKPNNSYHQAMIGGVIPDSGVISNGYTGLLGELCILQNPISATRAKQIYDALSVA